MLYGVVLVGAMLLVALIPAQQIMVRMAMFVIGAVFCALGVSLFFHTYISAEAYELFVKELSAKYQTDIGKFKTVYDVVSCLVSVALSFAFFGLFRFEGVKIGKVICAALNGYMIGGFSRLLNKFFTFEDKLPLRVFFEK